MKHDKTAGSRIVCTLVYISGFEIGTKNAPYVFYHLPRCPFSVFRAPLDTRRVLPGTMKS